MLFDSSLLNPAALSADEASRLKDYQRQLPKVQALLQQWYDDHSLPMLHLPEETSDLKEIQAIARHIRATAKGLLVLGTGGSSLGGQTLCTLADGTFPVWFIDNLDPVTLQAFFVRTDLADIHVIAISKSGGTVETISQLLRWIDTMIERGYRDLIAARCHCITVPGTSPLRDLAAHFQVPVLDHDPAVGGRYSVLSLVGLLPAAVAGVDVAALRRGACAVWKQTLQMLQAPTLQGAAWQAACMDSRPICVLMPYADRLELFGAWYKQLWAESIGKSCKGSTPARALGAVDQHSQLQLYLDGPRDKTITFVTLPYAQTGAPLATHGIASLNYLAGFTDGDVMASLQHGTIETVTRHDIPVREIKLPYLDAEMLGGLLMHFMIETIATAQLIDVDAFDQPAVEESKQLARDYLASRRHPQGSVA